MGEVECSKMPFISEHAARESRGSKRNKGRRMRVYLCECGFWHLTTQTKKSEKVRWQ